MHAQRRSAFPTEALPAMNETIRHPDLELYALDALPPEERTAVEAHVQSCASCRAGVAQLRALTVALRGVAADDGGVPVRLRQRLHREIWAARLRERIWSCQPVWLRAAALLVALLGLGFAGVSAWAAWRGAGMTWTQAGICAQPGGNGCYPVVSGQIVVALEKKEGRQVLLAMDRNTGLHLWESSFAVSGGPSIDGERVYVWRDLEGNQFCLAALDIASGREVWTAGEPVAFCRHPWPMVAAYGGVAWSDDRQVVLLDGASGIVRWTHAIPDEGALSAPASNLGCLFVASALAVRALDAEDGHILWRSAEDPVPLSVLPALVQCDDRRLVVVRGARAGKGLVTCRDAATGAPRWRRETEMPWHVVMDDGRVFLRGAQIQALDGRTGSTVWSVPMGGCSPIELCDGCVYTVEGLERKGIYALRADTGKLVWTRRMLSSCSGFSVSGRMGYLSAQDGTLRAVVIRRRGS
jgi:outer membrane protein assembly factor BamB